MFLIKIVWRLLLGRLHFVSGIFNARWTENAWNHTASFRHQSKRNETELSKHIWALKDNNKPFNIKWRIIKQCRPYSNVSNKCNLCLFEKFIIIYRKNLCSLNKRDELASSCPHRNRYPLKNFFYKITQSFVTSLGLPLFLHLIATALKFLHVIAP